MATGLALADRRARARGRAGFTLVELIAVIVVLAIVAAVAMPRVGAMSDGRAGMAAAMLQRDLLFARERAVNTGVVHWVEFSVGAGSYTLSAEQPPSYGFASRQTLRDPASNASYQRFLNRDELAGVTLVSVNLSSNPIGFNRMGRPITTAGALIAGDGVVTLTGGRTVTVTGSTGLALRSATP